MAVKYHTALKTTMCGILFLEILMVIWCVLCVVAVESHSRRSNQDNSNSNNRDLYAILGVSRSATDKDIKRAYRKMALKYHPDKVKKEEAKDAEAKFILINKAYEILGDKEKRAAYDKYGESAFDGTGQQRHSEDDDDFPFEGFGESNFGGFNFKHSDFFDDFFDSHMRSHNDAHGSGNGNHFEFHFGDFFDDDDDDDEEDSLFAFDQSSGGQRCRTQTVVRGNMKTVTTVCN